MEKVAPEDETAAATLPRQLGSYLLLQRLGRGGMGTVYLARQQLGGDFNRFCVVKLVRRRHLGDPLLRQRFLDEARTTLLLTHRNICRVLDVGMAEGMIYLAMEHVSGRDLRSVLKACALRGTGMPAEIAALILGEILEALDSAHRLVDPATGKPLEIVHRDVSPHNVMVSFEGEVKLIDFGVARSATQLAQTDPGLVVGKLAYMSPEQSSSLPIVDGRSDVFAAGILGYETFAADRFYSKHSVDEIGQMLDDGGYKPPRFDALPPGVQTILQHALTHDVDKRPRAGALRQELMAWAIEQRKVASAADLRAFLAELFPGEEEADRKRFRSLISQDAGNDEDDFEHETVSEGSLRATKGASRGGSASRAEATVQERKRTRSEGGNSSGTGRSLAPSPSTASITRRRRAPWLAAGLALFAAAGAAVGFVVVRPKPAPATIVAVAPTTPPTPLPPPAVAVPPVAKPADVATPARDRPPDRPADHPAERSTATKRTGHRPDAKETKDPPPKDVAKEPPPPVEPPKPEAKVEVPALPPRPRLLAEKVRYLHTHCSTQGCAADAQSKLGKVASMNADQTEAFKADVDRCLDACGAK